jgi:mono/diheme cytochrome c family protein
MKRVLLIIIVLGLAALGAGAYALSRGFSARTEPSAIEAFIARPLRRLAIPARARTLKNPVPGSPEVLSRAMAHFADHCASCHGNDGKGTTLIGRGLYPKPPDMTEPETQRLTDGEIYYIIENGIRFTGMPAFGEEAGNDNEQESWDLVHFIRHLPQLTPDEVAQMKEMNPKSPSDLAREEDIRKFLQGNDSPPAENAHAHHH